MVRESRFIKVKLLPLESLEDDVSSHFERYGKVQSVRLENADTHCEAVVAYTDIKAASHAYNEDQMFNGAIPLSIAFCDAVGNPQSEARCPTTSVAAAASPEKQKAASGQFTSVDNSIEDSIVNTRKDGSGTPDVTKDGWRRSRSKSPSSRSRSRSISTESSRSSRMSRSKRSDGSNRLSIRQNVIPSDPNRPHLGIKITSLPLRSSDTSLRDGLFHEYKKHGKVTQVVIEGKETTRFAIVSFKKPEEAEKALEASKDKHFFGAQIQVETHPGFETTDTSDETEEPEFDEYNVKATRTLFCGNLEPHTSSNTLRESFDKYGDIVEVEIKKQGAASSYAFVQFMDIRSVVRALKDKDDMHIGSNKVKLGFGKSMPTVCLWLDDIPENTNDNYLRRQMLRFGNVLDVIVNCQDRKALVTFRSTDEAVQAHNEIKNRQFLGRKLMVDYASYDFQTKFRAQLRLPPPAPPPGRPGQRDDRFNDRGCIRLRNDERYNMGGFTEQRGGRFGRPGGGDYNSSRGPDMMNPGGRWNDDSMSPRDQRRDKRPYPSQRSFDSPASRGSDKKFKGGYGRACSPSLDRPRTPSPSSTSRNRYNRFSRSPPPSHLVGSRSLQFSRSPPSRSNSNIGSPRQPIISSTSPSTPNKEKVHQRSASPSRYSNNHSPSESSNNRLDNEYSRHSTRDERKSRLDEWKKSLRSPGDNSQSSLNKFKFNHDNGKRPSSPGGATTPVGSDHEESDGDQGLDDLQRKRNELLSQLQGLEDCPTPDSEMSGRDYTESNADHDSSGKQSELKGSLLEGDQTEALDSRLSIREQYEKLRKQTEVEKLSGQVSTPTTPLHGSAKQSLDKTTSNSPKSDCGGVNQASTQFKKKKKDDRSYRKSGGKGTEEIPLNGSGPPREQVIKLWDKLKARQCMSICKPCDLELPRFAMLLMHSPGSPITASNRKSMDSPTSSPTQPSPVKAFSTEKIPIIKADADDIDADDNEDLSPAALEIQEQIRKLNEKLSLADKAMAQAPKDIRPAIDLSKYKRYKKTKVDLGASTSFKGSSPNISAVSTAPVPSSTTSSSLWSSRPSMFDQDSKRLMSFHSVAGSTGTTMASTLLSSATLSSKIDESSNTLLTPPIQSSAGANSINSMSSMQNNIRESSVPSVLSNFGKSTASVSDSHPTSAESWRSSTLPAMPTEHQQHNLPPAASSLPPHPTRGILRRNSTNEDSNKSWQHIQDSKPADVTKSSADKSPAPLKSNKPDPSHESMSSPALKKEPAQKYDLPAFPVKQEKVDHSAYESSFGKQTEVKHDIKPTQPAVVKRPKNEFKPLVDLFKPDDDAVISTGGDRKKSTVKSSSASTVVSGKGHKEAKEVKEKTHKNKKDKSEKHDKSKDLEKKKLDESAGSKEKHKKKDKDKSKSKNKKEKTSISSDKAEDEKYKVDKEQEQQEKQEKQELERQKEAEKQKELEKQKEAERQREVEKQEAEKQREIEKQKALEKQKEVEKQREMERMKKEKKEMEKQKQEKQKELERQKAEKKKEMEKQKELERMKQMELEREEAKKKSDSSSDQSDSEPVVKKAVNKKMAKKKVKSRPVSSDSESDGPPKKKLSKSSSKMKSSKSSEKKSSSKKKGQQRVVETASSDEDEEADSMSSAAESTHVEREKTEEEKANWMAEYVPFYESMYDKLKRRRAASTQASRNTSKQKQSKRGKKKKPISSGSSSSGSSQSSDEESDDTAISSPARSPGKSPNKPTKSKHKALSSESEEGSEDEAGSKPAPSSTTPAPISSRISSTNKNNKSGKNKKIVKLTEAKTQLSKSKSESMARSESADEKSQSDSESEVDTAKSNMMKKKALVKMMAKRPTPAAVVKSKAKAARQAKKTSSAAATQSSNSDDSDSEKTTQVEKPLTETESASAPKKSPAAKRGAQEPPAKPAHQQLNRKKSSNDTKPAGDTQTEKKKEETTSAKKDVSPKEEAAKLSENSSSSSSSSSDDSSSSSSSSSSSDSSSSSSSDSGSDSESESTTSPNKQDKTEPATKPDTKPSVSSPPKSPVKTPLQAVIQPAAAVVKEKPQARRRPNNKNRDEEIAKPTVTPEKQAPIATNSSIFDFTEGAMDITTEAGREGTEFGLGSLESELVIDEGQIAPANTDTTMEDSSAVAALISDSQPAIESNSLHQFQPTEGAYKIESSTTEFNFGDDDGNTPASVASISESDLIARHMDEVIDAVSKGDFASDAVVHVEDHPPATPASGGRGGGRKRKTTTSSTDSAVIGPNKRQALSSVDNSHFDMDVSRNTVLETSQDGASRISSPTSPLSNVGVRNVPTPPGPLIPETVSKFNHMDLINSRPTVSKSENMSATMSSSMPHSNNLMSCGQQSIAHNKERSEQRFAKERDNLDKLKTLQNQVANQSNPDSKSSVSVSSPAKASITSSTVHIHSNTDMSSPQSAPPTSVSNTSQQQSSNYDTSSSRPESTEQCWDVAVDTHIKKSLDMKKPSGGDMHGLPPTSLSGVHNRNVLTTGRRSPVRSIPHSLGSPGLAVTSAGHITGHHAMTPHAPPGMMFDYFPTAGGDRIPRSPFPFIPWQPGQQHPADLQASFMMNQMNAMNPYFSYQQMFNPQSPLNSPLPQGIPMMPSQVIRAEERPPQPSSAQEQMPSPYLPMEDTLRRSLSRYPVVWQGTLALKADTAGVEMFFLCGNEELPERALPPEEEGLCLLRIAQRMRLEKQQLDGVDRKMEIRDDYCILLALPSSDKKLMDPLQTNSLQTGFIDYLMEKGAAGIMNVPVPGGNEPAYVVHVFFPCEFTMKKLELHRPEVARLANEYPHLVVIIATV